MKNIVGSLFGMLFSIVVNAQVGFVSISGDDSGSGSSSFTIGQVDFVNLSGGGYSVTEGIQQPYNGSVSVPENLTLLNNIFIPLGDSCAAFLTSEMFTLPSTTGLLVYASMNEIPSSFAGGAIYPIDTIYGEGEWMFGIYDPNLDEKGLHQLIGWGNFITEDKRDPHFVGDTTGLSDMANTVTDESIFRQYGTWKYIKWVETDGNLNNSNYENVSANWSCWQSTNHSLLSGTWPSDSTKRYKTHSFIADTSGVFTILIQSNLNWGSGTQSNNNDPEFDPIVAIYSESFDPNQTCQNLIGFGESSFIPNPLAGLGFTNGLSNSSIDGAQSDDAENFAPWLLHESPVIRIDFKAESNEEYVFVVSHREDSIPPNTGYKIYVLSNNYGEFVASNSGWNPDEGYSYFEFTCPDVGEIMIENQQNLSQSRYIGGSINEMSLKFFDTTFLSGDTYTNRQWMNKRWREVGEHYLGIQGKDTSLIDIDGAEEYDSVLTHVITAHPLLVEELIYHYGFMPMVIENCDDYVVNITDSYEALGDCGVDQSGWSAQVGGLNVSGIITRTFVVSDAGTKTDKDTARIQLVFRNPNLYDVRLPHYTVNIECDEVQEGLASTHPSSTGYPFVATLNGFEDLTPNNAACNLAAGYEDYSEVTSCANNQSFRREWTVYDWCRPGTTIVYNQLIRVGDWTAPTKEAGGSVTFLEDADGCTGTVVVAAPDYSDLCGSVSLSAKVYRGQPSIDNEIGYFGVEAGGSGELTGQEYGTYSVVWTASDDCGNAATPDTLSDTFTDNIAPSCVIDDMRSITLTDYGNIGSETAIDGVLARGQAWVTAERLDEGSWDNCGSIDSIHVRRMTDAGMSDWAEAISFTCEDEGVAVLVELKVADEAGNETICWTNITAVDKTQPECRDIGTVEYYCDELPSGDDLSGTSAVWGQFFDDSLTLVNISKDELCSSNMEVFDTEVHIDQCGYGYVNRYYRVYRDIDGKEFADSCRMSLVFSEKHEYSYTIPIYLEQECANTTVPIIDIVENGCDLLTISHQDEVFQATADECYKIIRTTRLINWCEYNGDDQASVIPVSYFSEAFDTDSLTINVAYRDKVEHIYKDYQNNQVSDGSDEDLIDTLLSTGPYGAGTQSAPNEVTFWYTKGQPLPYNSENVNNGSIIAFFPWINGGIHTGFFEMEQQLKIYNNTPPAVVYATAQDSFPSFSNAEGCPGDVVITASLDDDCTSDINQVTVTEAYLDEDNDAGAESEDFDAAVMADISQADGQVTYTGTDLPAGTHRLRLVARDGCGNVRVEDHVFTVYDAKGPAPICIEGFAAELMPMEDGTARMAIVNAVDFVINNPIADCSGAVIAFEITRVTIGIDTILAADDLGTSLTLTCLDKGTIDVAVVATDAVGNADYCVTTITVQDNVTPCPDLEISLTGNITTEDLNTVSGVELQLNDDKKTTTGVDGGYFFDGLTLGNDYTVVPTKTGDDLNGVSTYDLVLISKHILGIASLNSPYKLIAADVNNSGTISTLDMILIRQRLLLQREHFSAQTNSWRFVPAEYSFPNPSNPWAATFPEVLNINDFNGTANGDFVAIKVGDVNNSALIDVQPRSNASFTMHVEDLNVKAGNEYTVSFKATAADVEGFQVALSYRGLELVDIVEGIVKADHFGSKFADQGILLTSWNGTAAEGELFGLVFRATQDVVLSEALSVSTRHLNAEAYNTAGEAMNVAINFNSGAVAEASFELKQNTPNPFKGETVIGFNLAEASHATLTINDVTGRVLKVVRGDFAKGANQVSMDSKELPAAGVLYYTLTAGAYTATKKMIIME